MRFGLTKGSPRDFLNLYFKAKTVKMNYVIVNSNNGLPRETMEKKQSLQVCAFSVTGFQV